MGSTSTISRRPSAPRTYGRKREQPLVPLALPPSPESPFRKSSNITGATLVVQGNAQAACATSVENLIAGQSVGVRMAGALKFEETSSITSISTCSPVKRISETNKKPASSARQSSLQAFFAPRASCKSGTTIQTSSSIRTETSSTLSREAPSPHSRSSNSRLSTQAPTKLRQLQFAVPGSSSLSPVGSLVTCKSCNMSYLRGTEDSETEVLHRKNCDRVTKGILWEDKCRVERDGITEVRRGIKFERRHEVATRLYTGTGRILRVDGSLASSDPRVSV